jgi:hypothetical protein
MQVAVRLLLCLLLAAPASAATDRQTRTLAWPANRALALDVTVGEVRITGSARADLEIAIQRTAPSAEALRQWPIAIEESPERVAVSLVQPDGAADLAFRTDVVLRVPADAVIERLRVADGRLSVERFRGGLTAEVRRGPIEGTDVSGTLRLETGIGPITLKQARLAPEGLLRLRAFNGDVRLFMPGPPADAHVMALALNGTIQSDIPLTTRQSWGPRWSEATLGRGEPAIAIDVVTGRVEIRTR